MFLTNPFIDQAITLKAPRAHASSSLRRASQRFTSCRRVASGRAGLTKVKIGVWGVVGGATLKRSTS
jgi:hypothetical protein